MCSFSCLFLCSCVIDTAANKAHITLQLQSSYRKMTLSTAHLVWRCCCDCFLSAKWLPDKHSCMLMTRWLQRVPFICFLGNLLLKITRLITKAITSYPKISFYNVLCIFLCFDVVYHDNGVFRTGLKMQDHAGLQ